MTEVCTVTGGGGFIGAHLVKYLVKKGNKVRVIDNMARGSESRFSDVAEDVELFTADVRDREAVGKAIKGSDVVYHLAAINGTENFYREPELVLDVGLRGALAVVEACRDVGVTNLVVASSAEVYQTPPKVPTNEDVALMLPNSLNPRYSYGGSKIVSELIAFNYAQEHFEKVQCFRPHNVYGPNMGWKHVVPQFLTRAIEARETGNSTFEIQSDGSETRAFAFVDDVVKGIVLMRERGEHRQVYHIGSEEEVTIKELVKLTGDTVGFPLDIVSKDAFEGGTPRRCPDITKMRALGYDPHVDLKSGIAKTAEWYEAHRDKMPSNALM
ncbi:MAG: NAD-dependent epimerase/dehydratase family protein [Pseudomonadota bacterium]